MLYSSLIQLAALAAMVSAHPGEVHERKSTAELIRRESAAAGRHLLARNCASTISSMNAKRRAKRALAKRGRRDDISASVTSSADVPHVTTIQNWTCVTAPEVTEGPYYINNEIIRKNLTEDQPGVQLILDIGVLDINTCEPLSNAFVEIWAANATGVYGGYPAQLGGGGGGPPSGDPNSTVTDTATVGPPSGPPGGPGGPGGGGGGGSQSLARNETFLRGGLPTDDNGVVEIITVYPGFYSGRTAHIHTMVHTNWTANENGTLSSHAGKLLHIGQFFFEEDWNDKVYASEVYVTNTNERTYNVDDSILWEENSDGNNAFVDLELVGDDVTDGIYGYITMGVDSTASYSIMNSNYYNSTTESTTTDAATEATGAAFYGRAMGQA